VAVITERDTAGAQDLITKAKIEKNFFLALRGN
jgi:hypothetical protein